MTRKPELMAVRINGETRSHLVRIRKLMPNVTLCGLDMIHERKQWGGVPDRYCITCLAKSNAMSLRT